VKVVTTKKLQNVKEPRDSEAHRPTNTQKQRL